MNWVTWVGIVLTIFILLNISSLLSDIRNELFEVNFKLDKIKKTNELD